MPLVVHADPQQPWGPESRRSFGGYSPLVQVVVSVDALLRREITNSGN